MRRVEHAGAGRRLLGDDEGGKEWSEDSVTNCVDGRGDDDIEIILKETGATSVKYLNQSSSC